MRASMSLAMTSELSAFPSEKSLRRLMGIVPADSMSQLVKVRLPNWVDLAVSRSMLRFCVKHIPTRRKKRKSNESVDRDKDNVMTCP